MVRVRSPQDLGAGAVFVTIGAAGLYFGQDLAFGSSARMGPGYFPTILSYLIIAIGLVLAVKSLATDGPPIERFSFRPLFAILHYDQGLDVVVAVGLLGLFWGVTYIKRRSAVTGMVNHACFNAAQVLQAALAKSFGM